MKKGLKVIAMVLMAISCTGLFSGCAGWFVGKKDKMKQQMLSVAGYVENDSIRKIVAVTPPDDVLPSALESGLNEALKNWNDNPEHKNRKRTRTDVKAAYAQKLLSMQKKLTENCPGIVFVDRSKLDQIMKEHSFQLSDWADENKSAQIGKALNADALVTLEAPRWDADWGEVYGQYTIVNINTMAKVVFDFKDKSWAKAENSQQVNQIYRIFFEDTDDFGVGTTMQFDGIKKSAFSYNEKNLADVCPFPLGDKPIAAKPRDALSKSISSIEEIRLAPEEKSCTVIFEDGREEEGSLKLSLHKTENQKVKFTESAYNKLPDGTNCEEENYEFFYIYNVELTTWNRGKVKIKTESLDLSGDMFIRGKNFVIDYKADKDDGTGHHYFAFFTVEE